MIERLQLTGTRLDASKLCGLKGVKGTLDEVSVDLHGEVNPRRSAMDYLGLGQVYARADHLTVLDDRYSAISACLNRRDDARCRARPASADTGDRAECEDGKRAAATGGNGFCVVASATRDAGGTLDATIARLPAARPSPRSVVPAHLGGVVSLADLPLALIDQLRGKPRAGAVGGLASITLHLQGLPGAPQAVGAVQLLRAWLAGGFLGDAQLAVEPTVVGGVAGVKFAGSALAGRLEVTGALATAAAVHAGARDQRAADRGRSVPRSPGAAPAARSGPGLGVGHGHAAHPARPVAAAGARGLGRADRAHRAARPPRQRRSGHAAGGPGQGPEPAAARGDVGARDPVVVRARVPRPEAPQGAPSARRSSRPRPATSCSAATRRGARSRSPRAAMLDLGKLRVLLDRRFDYVAGAVRLAASLSGEFDHPAFSAEIDLDPDQVWTRNEAERQARRAAAATRHPRPEAPILPGENPVVLRPIGSDTVLDRAARPDQARQRLDRLHRRPGPGQGRPPPRRAGRSPHRRQHRAPAASRRSAGRCSCRAGSPARCCRSRCPTWSPRPTA